VAGIRPESFAPAADGPADDVLDLPVVLVEALGSDLLVHLESDADAVLTGERLEAAVGMDEAEAAHEVAVAPCARLVARLPPGTRTRAGERLRVRVDLDRLHVFDRVTGAAVR
jgi:multiple sugar transport system ATP-binding protein